MPEHQRLDEIWNGAYERDGNVLTRKLYQPERRQILQAVQTIRSEGVVQDRPFLGRWCLSIPHEDMEALRRSPKWCELAAVDNATRQAAWRRFLVSPDSAPYRVRENAS